MVDFVRLRQRHAAGRANTTALRALCQRRVLIIVENLPRPVRPPRAGRRRRALRDAGYGVSVICPTGKGCEGRYEVLDGIDIYRHPLPAEAAGALGYALEYAYRAVLAIAARLRVLRRARLRRHPCLQSAGPALPRRRLLQAVLRQAVHLRPPRHQPGALRGAKFGRRDSVLQAHAARAAATFAPPTSSIATNESYRRIAIERGGMEPGQGVRRAQRPPQARAAEDRAGRRALKRGPRYLVGYVGVMGKQEGIDYCCARCAHIVHTLGRDDVQFGLVGGGTLAARRCTRWRASSASRGTSPSPVGCRTSRTDSPAQHRRRSA